MELVPDEFEGTLRDEITPTTLTILVSYGQLKGQQSEDSEWKNRRKRFLDGLTELNVLVDMTRSTFNELPNIQDVTDKEMKAQACLDMAREIRDKLQNWLDMVDSEIEDVVEAGSDASYVSREDADDNNTMINGRTEKRKSAYPSSFFSNAYADSTVGVVSPVETSIERSDPRMTQHSMQDFFSQRISTVIGKNSDIHPYDNLVALEQEEKSLPPRPISRVAPPSRPMARARPASKAPKSMIKPPRPVSKAIPQNNMSQARGRIELSFDEEDRERVLLVLEEIQNHIESLSVHGDSASRISEARRTRLQSGVHNIYQEARRKTLALDKKPELLPLSTAGADGPSSAPPERPMSDLNDLFDYYESGLGSSSLDDKPPALPEKPQSPISPNSQKRRPSQGRGILPPSHSAPKSPIDGPLGQRVLQYLPEQMGKMKLMFRSRQDHQRPVEIGTPTNVKHIRHVGVDKDSGEFFMQKVKSPLPRFPQ